MKHTVDTYIFSFLSIHLECVWDQANGRGSLKFIPAISSNVKLHKVTGLQGVVTLLIFITIWYFNGTAIVINTEVTNTTISYIIQILHITRTGPFGVPGGRNLLLNEVTTAKNVSQKSDHLQDGINSGWYTFGM